MTDGTKITHEAYRGVGVDHLYRDCPSLQRAIASPAIRDRITPTYGMKLIAVIDPEDSDTCGLCRRRWKAKGSQ